MSSCRSSRAAGLALACAALMAAVLSGAGATQYSVGGDGGWAVPGAGAESYNTWAEKTGFQTGDQLLFVYPKGKDSVLLVEPAAYNACNTSAYDKAFSDGSTVFDLDRAGAFFFISGVDASCRANEKLIVMVAAAPPPSQGSSPPSPPSAEGSAPPSPPSTPAAAAKNSTANGGPPAAAGDHSSGAGRLTVAGLAGSFVAWLGYAAMLV